MTDKITSDAQALAVLEDVRWMPHPFMTSADHERYREVYDYLAARLAAPPAGWQPLRTAPYGEEVVVQMDDSSELVGAIQQHDGDWWWRHSFWSADFVQAWRPTGKAAAPEAADGAKGDGGA